MNSNLFANGVPTNGNNFNMMNQNGQIGIDNTYLNMMNQSQNNNAFNPNLFNQNNNVFNPNQNAGFDYSALFNQNNANLFNQNNANLFGQNQNNGFDYSSLINLFNQSQTNGTTPDYSSFFNQNQSGFDFSSLQNWFNQSQTGNNTDFSSFLSSLGQNNSTFDFSSLANLFQNNNTNPTIGTTFPVNVTISSWTPNQVRFNMSAPFINSATPVRSTRVNQRPDGTIDFIMSLGTDTNSTSSAVISRPNPIYRSVGCSRL